MTFRLTSAVSTRLNAGTPAAGMRQATFLAASEKNPPAAFRSAVSRSAVTFAAAAKVTVSSSTALPSRTTRSLAIDPSSFLRFSVYAVQFAFATSAVSVSAPPVTSPCCFSAGAKGAAKACNCGRLGTDNFDTVSLPIVVVARSTPSTAAARSSSGPSVVASATTVAVAVRTRVGVVPLASITKSPTADSLAEARSTAGFCGRTRCSRVRSADRSAWRAVASVVSVRLASLNAA